MKKIELIWNIVHYFVYRADYKAHLVFNKINPLMLINKLPFQRRMYERRGINISDELDRSFKDPKNGVSSMRAGGFMFILCAVLGYVFFCLVIILRKSYLPGALIFIFGIPFAILNFFVLFYKDKYLAYFKIFDMKPNSWRKKWKWISLGIILLIFALVAGGMSLETAYSLQH